MLLSINIPVADLRAYPEVIFTHDYTHQEERLSQLSFGDPVFLHDQKGDWLFVSAIEQLRVKDKQWQPYLGWLHVSEVAPAIHRERSVSFTKKVDVDKLLNESELFLDLPYLWGGCSPSIQGKIASVDCSGLIYQLFKRQGRLVPRDAHDQFLAAKPVHTPQSGDLLFLTPLKGQKKRMTHVMIVYDKERYLEAPESNKKVRLLKTGPEIWQKNGVFHIFDREKLYLGFFGRLG
jgi:hypothetical protein